MAAFGLQTLMPGNCFDTIGMAGGFMEVLQTGANNGDYTQIREELDKNPAALYDMFRKYATADASVGFGQDIARQLSNFLSIDILDNDNAELLEILLDAGLSPDTPIIEAGFMVTSTKPVIFMAVDKGAEKCVSLLLERGANPNAEAVGVSANGFGQSQNVTSTPLNCAVAKENAEIVDLLLKSGADTFPDTIYTAYAVAECQSPVIYEKIENEPAWNIDGVNWFEAMISNAGIAGFVENHASDVFEFGTVSTIPGCITTLYKNDLLVDFLVRRGYITTEFIDKTIVEARTLSQNTTVVNGLNRFAEAGLLNGISSYSAMLVREEAEKAKSISDFFTTYKISPELEDFVKSAASADDDDFWGDIFEE